MPQSMDRIRQWQSSRYGDYQTPKESFLDPQLSQTALTSADDRIGIPMGKVDHTTSKSNSRIQAPELSASQDAILLAPSDAEESRSSRSQSPNPKSVPLSSARRKLKELAAGWRVGTLCWFIASLLAFLVNLFTTIGLVSSYDIDGDGISMLMHGQCSAVKTTSLWIHVGINILSTTLLSASNYCMQLLSAPTREEVDRAHHKGRWLDIGVHSIRNLFMIRSKRVWLWVALGLSSVPLHLMYNSIIFQTLNSQQYQGFVIAEDFLDSDRSWDASDFGHGFSDNYDETIDNLLKLRRSVSSLERLSPEDCVRNYARDIIPDRKNFFAVTLHPPKNDPNEPLIQTVESSPNYMQSYTWLCISEIMLETSITDCDTSKLIEKASRGSWELYGPSGAVSIDYCLSERIEEDCRLQFSLPIMVVVVICNLGKVISMLLILYSRTAKPLANIGDAAASFLENSDQTTVGLCLSSKKDFPKGTSWTKSSLLSSQKCRQICKPTRSWWFTIPGIKRWIFTLGPGILALALSGQLLRLGLINLRTGGMPTDFNSLVSMGVGAINSISVINDGGAKDRFLPTSLTGFILLANLPQLIISMIYFMFNSIFTCMVLGHEWNSYAYKRKSLRVTGPVGQQRSTYYLTLPYSYAIPLMVMSGLLHWLVSQSFFLVRMDHYKPTGAFSHSISNCGYSCIAIIAAIIVGSVLVIFTLGMGCRRYRPGIPTAGSCSAAISAACHPPPGDTKAATMPVQWGAVDLFESSSGVGHCSFTSREVSMPVAGRLYAGLK